MCSTGVVTFRAQPLSDRLFKQVHHRIYYLEGFDQCVLNSSQQDLNCKMSVLL